MVMKYWKQVSAVVVVLVMCCSTASAEMLGSNRNFRKYNPDWKKYEFTRDYLTSLGYIKKNYDADDVIDFAGTEPDILNRIALMRDELIHENVNLRVARNYLKRYTNQAQNGLMLKVSDQFTKVCDELIQLNSGQRTMLEEMHTVQRRGAMDAAAIADFEQRQSRINGERREALKGLLRASILVTKILVSPTENYYGEFDRLGITQEQRFKLLEKIRHFDEASYQGELRSGQSFLEGSVVTIREILENYNYETIDG
ncbi:MAG: hypothetical protein KC900_10660 [Candidatus Omnitrophica bacterium]|nr:hypothetical protein [Candidatus Omnitrophota bacterium]